MAVLYHRWHIQRWAPSGSCAMCKSKAHAEIRQVLKDGSFVCSNYLSALKQPNVETVTSPVERFTEHQFVTADGKSHEVDVVIMATGYDVVCPQRSW